MGGASIVSLFWNVHLEFKGDVDLRNTICVLGFEHDGNWRGIENELNL